MARDEIEDINDEGKWTRFVEKLIRLTQSGDLEWNSTENYVTPPMRERIDGPFFMSEPENGRYVGIYRREYDHFYDEETYSTATEVVLELVDKDGFRLWTLPRVLNGRKLLDIVEFKNADVDGFLDSFMKGESDDQ